MTIMTGLDRRQLLLGSAGAALVAQTGGATAAPVPAQGEAGALPMPAPTDTLPPPVLAQDPSRTRLDRGWLFHEGDIATPAPEGHNATYLRAKAGSAAGAAAMEYDDSDWQTVRLPHDWAAAQPVEQSANVSQGYKRRGIGWYRRTLRLDPADRGKQFLLQFDAIATNATIWANGSIVSHNWSGYNGIEVDLTPFARFGDELNVIVIRADAAAMEGWWYEGAGLYRHAWLAVRAPVSIVTDGVHCDPRKADGGGWSVPVVVTLSNIAPATAAVEVEAVLLGPDERVVAQQRVAADVATLETTVAAMSIDPGTPQLWSVETPTLYTLRTRVLQAGKPVDERRTPIGFRTARFDAQRGFFLNDKPVKLKGVCLHQDHAGVGVAVPDALIAWRLQRLKAMGCNAIRCSHNAPAAEFLDLCDRMGFLVMDENRLFNPAPDYMAQLTWLVRRDRNHPSVILWSVFNEEPMQGTEAGVAMVRRMAHAVHALDDSRPVTAAMNGAYFDPINVSSVVDVVGFNYYQGDYDRFHALNPTKPMTSSEDTSSFETRGAYETDAAAHVITSYDTAAADWGGTHRDTWKKIVERPFVAGTFVWTGFDYHGEPTPHEWPTVSSFFGIMDLCGFAKTAFDIHSAHWIDDRAVVAIAPHWTWPGREGEPIAVFVSSNAERVELRLNGKTLGTQAVDRVMGNSWTVPYAAGRIEAIASSGGRVVAQAAHETCGPPVALRLTPARAVMAGDGEDAQPVTVDAIDSKGRHVPTANLPVRFAVEGAAIIGLGNGDPNSHEPEQGDARSLFNGLAQAIVRADAGRGRIVLRASAPGLKPARLAIDRAGIAPPAQVATVASAMAIREWRRSPAFASAPDPALKPADGDNNSWAFVRSGTATPAEAGRTWRLYRSTITPWRRVAEKGGVLDFAGLTGTARLFVDGTPVAIERGKAAMPAGAGPRVLLLVIEADAGKPSGITGRVSLTSER